MHPIRRGVCLGWCNQVITGWYCPACKKEKNQRDRSDRPATRKRVIRPDARNQGAILLYDRRSDVE